MKRQTLKVLAACVSLFVLAGRAPAAIVIDENFDANPGIQSPVQSVDVGMMTMAMWMGGGTPSSGDWRYVNSGMGNAMGSLVGMGMGMVGVPTWSTLTFFAAKPAGGWGGDVLELSFDYKYNTDSAADTEAKFGVYGWLEGSPVALMDQFPGADGTELIAGLLTPSGAMSTYTYTHPVGVLSRSDYIGVTFTIGDKTGDLTPGDLTVDNVKVNIVPEPSTLLLSSLGLGTVAWVRRLRKKRRLKQAAGPPG